MTINTTTLNAVTLISLLSTDNTRWHRAIVKAAAWLKEGNAPRQLPNGNYVINSRTNHTRAYEVNGHCQCQAGQNGNPCWHRAAARLWERYQVAEALRQRFTYQGRGLAYTTTPAGEAILEDADTGRCFSATALADGEPGVLEFAPAETAQAA